MRLQKEQKSRGPAKRKHFQITLHKKHQSRVREQMVTDCETSLSFLGLHNFVGTKIEIFNENTHEYETLNLVDEEHIQTSSQTEGLTNENIDEVNLPLYIKERFDVSNEAYHKLTIICKHLPRSWKIQDRIREAGWDLISPEELNYLGTLILPRYYPIKANLLKFHSCGLNL